MSSSKELLRELLQVREIVVRFGGRAVLIDTGMLNYYQGRASALEINGDQLTAIYEDGRVPLAEGPPNHLRQGDGGQAGGRQIAYAVLNQATVSRSPSSSVTVGR